MSSVMESLNCDQSHQSAEFIGVTDHLLEILSWMPAKAVIKYLSSLSKTLSNLPREPPFIERQSIHSSLYDGGFFLQPDTCNWDRGDLLDFHVLSKESPSMFGIPIESLSFLQQYGPILSSSQGLVLVRKVSDDTNDILICNPATRSCTQLPFSDRLKSHEISHRGILIECHPRNLKTNAKFPNDYTITLPIFIEEDDGSWGGHHELAVYRNGKWDSKLCDLRVKGRDLRLDTPVGVFGGDDGGLVIHYLCDSLVNALRTPIYLEPYVVAFDVEKKKLWKTIKLPKGAWIEDGDHEKLRIFRWRETETIGLMRIDPRKFTVWVLEDYVSISWRKVMSKTTLEMGVWEEYDEDVVGWCIVNGRELVFATINWVYEYDMEGGRLEVVAENECWEFNRVVFTPYANTLRPLCGEKTSIVTF